MNTPKKTTVIAFRVSAESAERFKRIVPSKERRKWLERAIGQAETIETLALALKRATPWLGKLVADGGHLKCVLPNDAVTALKQAEDALREKGVTK